MQRKVGIKHTFKFDYPKMRRFSKRDRVLLMMAHGGEFTNDERTVDRKLILPKDHSTLEMIETLFNGEGIPDENSPEYLRAMESVKRRLKSIEKACMQVKTIDVYESAMEDQYGVGTYTAFKNKKHKRTKPITVEEKEIEKLEKKESVKVAVEAAAALDSEENK